MNPWTERLLGAGTGVVLGITLGTAAITLAQGTPAFTPPPASCEQQLDQAQRVILNMRKNNAQIEFNAATAQEQLMDLQKKVAELEAKSKAAAK
jgi:hypothetical protein